VLRLTTVLCEALLRLQAMPLSGFGLFLVSRFDRDMMHSWMPYGSLVVTVCPRAHSVRMMPPLRHVLPGLPASFCQ
jgi:hypothetical protein